MEAEQKQVELHTQLVPGKLVHAAELALSMSPDDVEECKAGGLEPMQALVQSLNVSSVVFAALVGGRVGAMFGVRLPPKTSVLDTHEMSIVRTQPPAQLWYLTGVEMQKAPISCMRLLRSAVHKMFELYPGVPFVNHIHASHNRALRLAQWLGARIDEPQPWGVKGELFCKFTLERD